MHLITLKPTNQSTESMETPPTIHYIPPPNYEYRVPNNEYENRIPTTDDFGNMHDFGYDSLSTSHFDGMSETSEECSFSIYEQTSTDSVFDEYDDLSSSYSIFETDSSLDELQSGSGNNSVRDNQSQSSINSRRQNFPETAGNKETSRNGILKRKDITMPNIITRDAIEKIRENELEDVLQHARDIVTPDPAAKQTCSTQPAKVVTGSFRHLLSIKENHSKTGAFVHRTIEIIRNMNDELGFSVREGDGWEKKGGIFVSRVALGTVFDQYGILAVGDEVLQVNKVDIRCMKVNDVVRLMYIPHRLCITVKVLTPFSKKRVAHTKLGACASRRCRGNSTNNHEDCKPISDNFYKVAQLHIGPKKRGESGKSGKTILVRNKKGGGGGEGGGGSGDAGEGVREGGLKKLSPYRTMEGGKLPPMKLKKNLSPIQESSGEMERSRDPRKQPYVTWSDLKGN